MGSESPQSLCPGFRQVEQFGPEEEYEEYEEITYITLDLGNVEPTLVPSASSYYLIGLDTPTPYLQLQGTVLKGRHHNLLGTELIFAEDKELHKRTIQHVANTEQRILFKEVILESKTSPISLIPRETLTGTAEGLADDPQSTVMDVDGQQIDRMTGKLAPLARLPRSKGTVKKKATESGSPSKSRKGKEKAEDFSAAPPSDVDAVVDEDELYAMDTT